MVVDRSLLYKVKYYIWYLDHAPKDIDSRKLSFNFKIYYFWKMLKNFSVSWHCSIERFQICNFASYLTMVHKNKFSMIITLGNIDKNQVKKTLNFKELKSTSKDTISKL